MKAFLLMLLPVLPASAATAKKAPPAAAPVYEEDYEDANVQSAGGIVKFGETVVVQEGEQVDGPVVAIGGSARVDGAVNGPVVSIGGSTELGPRSEVNGPAVSIGGKTVRHSGSRIEGPIIDTPGARFFGGLAAAAAYLMAVSAGVFVLAKVSASLGWIVLGLVLLTFFPQNLRATKSVLDRKLGRCALAGLLYWPGLVVITMTLVLSLIGLPLVPLVLAAAAAAYVWGFTALGLLIGEKLARGRWDNPLLNMLVGMLALKALQWLPLISWLVVAAAAVLGVGATVLSRFGWKASETGN